MGGETKLKKQIQTCEEWALKARKFNEVYYVQNLGLLYTQVAIEQIIEFLKMKESNP